MGTASVIFTSLLISMWQNLHVGYVAHMGGGAATFILHGFVNSFVRVISCEEGKALAESWNAAFMESSAKENQVGDGRLQSCSESNCTSGKQTQARWIDVGRSPDGASGKLMAVANSVTVSLVRVFCSPSDGCGGFPQDDPGGREDGRQRAAREDLLLHDVEPPNQHTGHCTGISRYLKASRQFSTSADSTPPGS